MVEKPGSEAAPAAGEDALMPYSEYLQWGFLAILLICLLVQCFEDIRHHLLYDEISMLLAVTGFVRSYFFGDMRESLAGAGLCFLVLAGFSLYKRGGMGLGDLLLGTALGFWLGPEYSGLMLVLSFLAGACYAALLLIFNALHGDGIAFGPFLSMGMLVTYFYGGKIFDFYWQLSAKLGFF